MFVLRLTGIGTLMTFLARAAVVIIYLVLILQGTTGIFVALHIKFIPIASSENRS